MISKTLSIVALSVLALAGASGLLPPALASSPAVPGAAAANLLFAPTQTVKANGPAICNCTDADARLTLCHAEQVDVRIGGDSFSASTGQSSSSCASQTVPPGTCLYFRYSFSCEYRGFWVGWECHFVSAGLRDRPADPKEDC